MKEMLCIAMAIALMWLLTGCTYSEALGALDSGLRSYYTPRPTPVPVYYAP